MDWQPISRGDRFFAGGDPYFQLRTEGQAGKGFASPDPFAVRPAILRLRGGDPARVAEQAGVKLIPSFYINPNDELRGAEHCTALVDQQFIDSLKNNSDISRVTILPPTASEPAKPTAPPEIAPPTGKAEPGMVVVGIIDYGIAFAHDRFRLAQANTRIEYFWVQDASEPAEVAPDRPLPELAEAAVAFDRPGDRDTTILRRHPVDVNPTPYGREISACEIDLLLARLASGHLADEDSLYRYAAARLGQPWLRSVSKRTAHGTHVMDLACGYRLDEVERAQRPIIAVQLPEASTIDTSGENLDAYALDGIRYILDRADAIARQRKCGSLPVVINFSFGNVAGPHDGSSDLEQAIDELIEARPNLNVVVPSGNSHLARLHAEVEFEKPGQTVSLHWRVLPDDKTPSFLEIWLPRPDPTEEKPWTPGDRSRIELRIMSPGGQLSAPLEEDDGAGAQLRSNNEEVLCEARYRYIPGPPEQHGRSMYLVALQPTTWNDAAAPIAPSGVWTVELENVSFAPGALVSAWIQRDDTPYGFRARGRQSFFDEECYRRVDARGREIERDDDQPPCHVKRAGSTNAIATGRKIKVAGGFLRKEGRPARYSARNSAGVRPVPDYLAPTDDSLAHLGLRAAGTRSGSVVAINGTSVAAPQVTRWIASQLANGPNRGGAVSISAAAPAIGPDGWSDSSFAGAGIDKDRDRPSWPRPRSGARVAEGVVYDQKTGRPATPLPQGGSKPPGLV